MLRQARPEALEQRGLIAALSDHLAALKERYGLEIELESRGKGGLQPEVELALYRVAQEALTNIIKHAGVSRARASLQVGEGHATLKVSDDGAGFNPAQTAPAKGGYGMENMRQRVESLGGSFHVRSSPGVGTHIEVNIPLPVREAGPHG